MSFVVTEITTFEDWQTVQASMEDGLAEPYFPYWQLVKGPSDDDRVTRYWHIHQATPGSHWIKVSDPTTGEVAGAANWIINEANPFESLLIVPRASWWPEDDPRRDIANQMMQQFFCERPKRMDRPHVLLSIMFIAQKYRRRGFGSKLLAWGIDKADALGIEGFVEGTPIGALLYEKFGYVRVGELSLSAENRKKSPEWDETYKHVTPNGDWTCIMWRPKGGRFIQGETKYSWE